jgi:protein-L-isoaspartate(D-aspartate) O-methyltransferase
MELHSIEKARYNMVEQQIRPWNVENPGVLALLSQVKREDFIEPSYKALAFADMAIPLAGGQTMLEPRIQARLLQDADVPAQAQVLEIGAGNGYLSALLAQNAQRVISFELQPELAEIARQNLQQAGISNVDLRCANGVQGAPDEGPFDVILLGGSVQQVPEGLLSQLKIGGRLVAIVGSEPIMHALTITRAGEHDFKTEARWDDNAPALQFFPQAPNFQF